jgi:hypothetical protein
MGSSRPVRAGKSIWVTVDRPGRGLTRYGPFTSNERAEQCVIALAGNPNTEPNWNITIGERETR